MARDRPQADGRGRRLRRLAWTALGNCAAELGTGAQIRWSLRRRLEIICERSGIDEGRARAWTIVREADNAVDLAGDPGARDRISLAVMIIKAMND